MKKIYVITLLGCISIIANLYCLPACAQGTWTKKADFGGTTRGNAACFSIGTKGYIGTGLNASGNYRDFWEWDQSTNTWAQKANFGGTARYAATGFSIGTKGYIGTGATATGGTYYQDFWEWDGDIASSTYNTWTKKADFGGSARSYAKGFSIGTKGYIGTGWIGTGASGSVHYQDFWEWDQSSNTWTAKANFGGTARKQTVGFSIGSKGYIGTGHDGSYMQDFWEYDQANNQWTQKAVFGGAARSTAAGFSIGAKGYIGTGWNGSVTYQDFWEWDQATNIWTLKANFGGTARSNVVGFSIGTKGYIGTGYDGSFVSDFWEYDPNAITSIHENNIESSVLVFPNPFFTQTTFTLGKEVKDASLKIYNISGEEVMNINFSGKQVTIERENLSSGVYFYQITAATVAVGDPISGTGSILIQ